MHLAVVVYIIFVVVQWLSAVGATLADIAFTLHGQVIATAQASVPVFGVPLDIEGITRIGGRLFHVTRTRVVEMLARHRLQIHFGSRSVEKLRYWIALPRDGMKAEFESDPPAEIFGQLERILIFHVRRWRR